MGKVTDIAMKYGYESPTAFTRAFKNFHGITPSAVKTEPVSFQAYPPISFPWQSTEGAAAVQDRGKRSVPDTGTVLSPVERTDREF